MILCQITSQSVADSYAIPISRADFSTGGLQQDSNARPNRLFTADSSIILYQAGKLTDAKPQQITNALIQILTA